MCAIEDAWSVCFVRSRSRGLPIDPKLNFWANVARARDKLNSPLTRLWIGGFCRPTGVIDLLVSSITETLEETFAIYLLDLIRMEVAWGEVLQLGY